MKKIAFLLLLLSPVALAEPIGPFVFRVCKAKVRSDYTIISMPVIAKEIASMCVVWVPCESADFDILEVTSGSKMTHYTSRDSTTCR